MSRWWEVLPVITMSPVWLVLASLSLSSSSPLSLPPMASLLQAVVTGGGGTAVAGGGGTVTTTTTVPAVTTMPAVMAMAPMLPAVALGIVKALFICELLSMWFLLNVSLSCSRGYKGDEAEEMLRIRLSSRPISSQAEITSNSPSSELSDTFLLKLLTTAMLFKLELKSDIKFIHLVLIFHLNFETFVQNWNSQGSFSYRNYPLSAGRFDMKSL